MISNKYFFLFIIFLVISIVPVSANSMGEQQKDVQKLDSNVKELEKYKNGNLNYLDKLKLCYKLPYLVNDMRIAFNNVNNDKAHNSTTYHFSYVTAEADAEDIVKKLKKQNITVELNQIQSFFEISKGDIVQIVNNDGYLRYMECTNITDNGEVILESGSIKEKLSFEDSKDRFKGIIIKTSSNNAKNVLYNIQIIQKENIAQKIRFSQNLVTLGNVVYYLGVIAETLGQILLLIAWFFIATPAVLVYLMVSSGICTILSWLLYEISDLTINYANSQIKKLENEEKNLQKYTIQNYNHDLSNNQTTKISTNIKTNITTNITA